MNQTGIKEKELKKRSTQQMILALLLLISFACLIVSALVGSAEIDYSIIYSAFIEAFKGDPTTTTAHILSLRLSRIYTAFLTGASLALAGVMMQSLLRNPLADPYVLGVSGGASVGALCVLFMGGALWLMNIAAFAGAMIIALFLYYLTRKKWSGDITGDTTSLLLTGVILTFGCGAIVTLLLSLAPDGNLRGMVFWLIGDLESTHLNAFSAYVLIVVLIVMVRFARALNIISLYAENAISLGVDVVKVRKALFIGGALLTATAVTNSGCIGFIGLIVPHFCRRIVGSSHYFLIVTSVLVGGSFLVLADLLARTILAPQQLPVGVVTAVIGVPVFLFQLYRFKGASHA